MKRKVPKFRRKVQGVPGDCMLPGLGLTSADKQLLVKNVSLNVNQSLSPFDLPSSPLRVLVLLLLTY